MTRSNQVSGGKGAFYNYVRYTKTAEYHPFLDIEDKKKRISVDSKAAKRVVKHELHQFKKKPKTDYE